MFVSRKLLNTCLTPRLPVFPAGSAAKLLFPEFHVVYHFKGLRGRGKSDQGVGGGLPITNPQIFVICHPVRSRCQIFASALPGMTWFGHGEVEKTSTGFSFHSSNPQTPEPGFIWVWTKTWWNIGRHCKLYKNRETTGPKYQLSHCSITCLFWKNNLEGKWKINTVGLCVFKLPHTPLSPYVLS